MKKNNLLCSSRLHFFEDKNQQSQHFFEDTFAQNLHFFDDNALYAILESKSTLTKIHHPSIKYPTNIAIFAHTQVSKKDFIQRKQNRDFGYIKSMKNARISTGIASFEVWRNSSQNSSQNLNHYSTTNSAPKPGQESNGHSTWTIGLQSVDTQQLSKTASENNY